MPRAQNFTVQVNLPKDIPDDIKPTLHVFDTFGQHVTSASVPRNGATPVRIPDRYKANALRFVTAPREDKKPGLKELRRIGAVERFLPYDPEHPPVIDIGEPVIAGWILCVCTVRGRVVKAVPQPGGGSVDYPVCNARVHICEVDRIPRIIFRIPDDIIYRLRDELLVGPLPDPIGPVLRRPIPEEPPRPIPRSDPAPILDPIRRLPTDRLPIERAPLDRIRQPVLNVKATAAPVEEAARMEMSSAARPTLINLARATGPTEIREALIDLAIWHPWWCWFPWLDPFFRYEVDCLWQTWTDSNGEFSQTIIYPCSDKPDIYLWVEQFIAGSWVTIHARGPRCGTHWNYDCGSEIVIHVTHPDAIVCLPPPEIVVPDDITTWVLPMAVGNLEIAGAASHAGDPLGWLQSDGTASYAAGPVNITPITDAPMGGYLRFKMLHSLDLPKGNMTRYSWSFRPKPAPDPTVPGGWTKMSETITRKYQIPQPGGFPKFPVITLGPDADELFEFRPHTPPAGVWPVSGFTEDLWSAKLDTSGMAPGVYQVRVTVHDGAGNVVAPGAGSFSFVATDTRDSAKETYETRAAAGPELIDDGFVFDVLIDNGTCFAQFNPTQTDGGATADACGFLRYADKATTNVTLSYEASHPRDRAWFQLQVVRGQTGLDQVEVMNGGLVGAGSVPVDSNGVSPWPNASYGGDGAGNFSGTFTAARFLESCDNGAFGTNLWVRAKAHDGLRRLHEYDDHDLMAFALAQTLPSP